MEANSSVKAPVGYYPPDANTTGIYDKMDRRLAKLVANLDRIAMCMEKSNVGIYKRVLNNSEIGNPGPCGLFAFALALAFYMASQVTHWCF